MIEQINWNLTEKNLRIFINNIVNVKKDHVLISYNTVSREVCLQIKDDLELVGYKVWIDVNDVHGFSLDSMTESVENSLCVLICISEKYRQSISCRTSAQYAFKLNKKIIPLIVQNGYDNVGGWLGVMMENKTCIDFTKHEYQTCMQTLNSELKNLIDQHSDSPPVSSVYKIHTPNTDVNTSNSAGDWSKKEVEDWFIKNNISMLIFDYLKPSSGSILKQMFQMKNNASEFYYNSLKEIDNIKFHEIVLFSSCLDKIFK